jgi:hypothetical protein
MVDIINAMNELTWPAAFAFGCLCLAVGVIGYAIFKV